MRTSNQPHELIRRFAVGVVQLPLPRSHYSSATPSASPGLHLTRVRRHERGTSVVVRRRLVRAAAPPSTLCLQTIHRDFYEESRWQKFSRRIKEEPLVPFGIAITCLALYRASRSIRARRQAETNKYFRYRIYAQGFTLACIYVGSIRYADDRKKRKEFEGALAEKKATEKREQWIKELEARERDDMEARQRRQAIRDGTLDAFAPTPEAQARKDAMASMDAEARLRKANRNDTQSSLTDPARAHRGEGVAKAVLEARESKRGILELLQDLR